MQTFKQDTFSILHYPLLYQVDSNVKPELSVAFIELSEYSLVNEIHVRVFPNID